MLENDPKVQIAEIFLVEARALFGELLGVLCERAYISQNKLGKKATEYRSYLMTEGYLRQGADTGGLDQSALSRIIKNDRQPSYAQVYIWLKVLRNIFESEEYRRYCARKAKPIYVFDEDLETDMWRLALFGTPKEVIEAYKRRKDMLKEQRQNDT